MPSTPFDVDSAEVRFRDAFERLKSNRSEVLPAGSIVSQNNVAKEAGRDPTALRKSRYPLLVEEIQAYVKAHEFRDASAGLRTRRLRQKRSLEEKLSDAVLQRDQIQSHLASANMRIIELSEQVQLLQQRLDDLSPPPVPFVRL